MDLLVTYDVATPDAAGQRRLARVARVCESYGERVQYSVFECRVSTVQLEHLITELDEIITGEDTIRFYRFPGALSQARFTLGRRRARETGDPWIL